MVNHALPWLNFVGNYITFYKREIIVEIIVKMFSHMFMTHNKQETFREDLLINVKRTLKN